MMEEKKKLKCTRFPPYLFVSEPEQEHFYIIVLLHKRTTLEGDDEQETCYPGRRIQREIIRKRDRNQMKQERHEEQT